MKLFKTLLVVCTLVVNFLIAQPCWAGSPKLTQTPDYAEVTKSLDDLIQAKAAPEQTEYTPEQIEQKIGELNLQKYILETALEWAQCRNQTGQTLGVYAHKAKNNQQPTLYYLGNGKITDDDWNCDGIYLPAGVKLASSIPGDTKLQELTEPLALKILPGTQLIAKTNVNTGAIELNIPPVKVFKTGETTWLIPNLTATNISTQIPNAPIED
ncbi:hypothetical protein G7B40_000540 [Aetokthonos hydrillicola Thurmond2011]|jgi:hypothetical protein|uniref:Uncharacterized protein n=1 Tax=Aetokthonos hydrillicola Thurmond2011 TaxID=2712845 RepID=A0AAP5M8A1_9CYAN|nr:hypothetical protein [Aetokthonos hydrillicola]MBO3460473.1 hypothetical protein [Aetokthonos hydrillicola CCALA 1050]MBW4588239.1 hypothetical protein [Aetokthonos hydrillicola CCALA 1050]MDR9893074.1 hypothetical protein [Aetokthonos hydrillicola Thurmond2011]